MPKTINNHMKCGKKAFKSKELAENISLNERDYYIQEMIDEIMRDFDKLAVSKIKEIFYY